MKEIYKKHPYINCMVSNFGNVKNNRNHIYKFNTKNVRYYRIKIDKKYYSVHRLVVETFISIIPPDKCVNHKDGNKHNNLLNNLEIVSYSQNSKHAFNIGLSKPQLGSKHAAAKLTDDQVIEIYRMIKLGYNNNQIAQKFNINFKHVSLIRHGIRWPHLFKKYMRQIVYSHGLKVCDLTMCFEIINSLSTMNNIDIARKFNIEPSLISRVRNKQTWKEVYKLYDKSKKKK